jgi:hypothetical protein
MDFAEVTKICYDYTITGLQNIAAVANNPVRFVYTSGVTVERDQSKSLPFLGEYRLMRVSVIFLLCLARLNYACRVVLRMLSWTLLDNTNLLSKLQSLSQKVSKVQNTPRVMQQRGYLPNLRTHLGYTSHS